ncbi:tyrosine-type recombinase/integrase [Agrobacterium rhizogenes]|nr:tyrosine-type recombinase/integrase [Rhizobium rhizogenes]NTH59483.1 tyrosine-type recombinase/integrase [Rhizobium rhizogenes]NTH90634.1 tyrosine-type recombinase/integrase [Rhizobium rhizogenes]
MAQPYLNGTFWWLRKKVPDDLRPLVGKREEKFSLKTRDPAEARILFAKAAAEIEERWGNLRRGRMSLTAKQAWALAGEIYGELVAKYEDNPQRTPISEYLLSQMVAKGHRVKIMTAGSDPELARKMKEKMLVNAKTPPQIKAYLDRRGWILDAESMERLVKATRDTVAQAHRQLKRYREGNYRPDPDGDKFPPLTVELKREAATPIPRFMLSDAIADWVKEKTRKDGSWVDSSAKSNQLWAGRFKDLIGDKPLVEYVKSDARRFKQAIMSLPPNFTQKETFEGLAFSQAVEKAKTLEIKVMSDTNVNKILGFVRAFWNWAQTEYDDIPSNLFQGMNLRKKTKGRDQRLPFSTEQLQKIFDAPLFTGCKSGRSWLRPGNHIPSDNGIYWVPLIGLYTGARSGEIIQLVVDDIKEEGGILYFNITDDGEDQNLKTDTSVRMIPVHPMLKRLGFEKFVAAQRKKGKRLFPDFPKAADGYYSTSYSPRFNRFLANIKVKTKKHTFHSFRHSFEDACINSRIPQEFTNALQGHGAVGMAARYGSGLIWLETLNEEIEKLDYRGLDFSQLMEARGFR